MRRSASSGRTGSACAARHTPTLNALVGRSGRLNSHRHDKTRLSCLRRVWCAVVNWMLVLNMFRLFKNLSVTVLSCRESSSHRRSRRDTDTVLSCLVWRCELAFSHTRLGIIHAILLGYVPVKVVTQFVSFSSPTICS